MAKKILLVDDEEGIRKVLGISLEDAVLMASRSPATFLKLEHETGSIATGNKASFVLLNKKMGVVKTWVDGDEF